MTTDERIQRTQQLTAQATAMTAQAIAWTQQIEAKRQAKPSK